MLVSGARHLRKLPLAQRRSGGAARLTLALVAGMLLVPSIAAAAPDPDHVNFRLEGCRLDAGDTLPNGAGDFVCTDDDYTTGNLGKNWNELDLVPHRLTASTGVAQTYTVAITADNRDGGTPGYDVISIPVVNTTLSTGTCSVTAVPADGAGALQTPGVGGTDTSIYRMLTITQSAGSTCVFDYYERLALGSSGYSGASLHSNLSNQEFGTAGIGARDVSIPVNEILPQGLDKTMTATTGSTTAWNITKDSSPTDLAFETCSGAGSAQAQDVTITINWTKSAVSASQVTLTSNITITNPAHRPISATVTDRMYSGTNQATQVGSTYTSPMTVVPASSSVTVTNTQSVPAGATHFNDVATASYTDVATGIAVPGTTTATAEADLVTITVPNDTATVSDTEIITGDGLSFSLGSTTPPATGSFSGGYVLGTQTTGPLTWTLPVTASGQIVFHKVVHVDGERNTAGTLSDVATLVDAANTTHTAQAATQIVARACIRGQKFNDENVNGVKDGGEPGVAGVTVYLDLDGDGVLDAGEPSAVTGANGNFVISTVNVPDGSYPLREVVPVGQTCSFPSPCFHTVVVGAGPAVTGQDFG
ncbi:MAG: trimeric autotransporter adhesin, partial [Solirubrobacteraceae bacterium]|nr:trimeric autotransporter adhesin [Solirubrobacteraceae bacterium]